MANWGIFQNPGGCNCSSAIPCDGCTIPHVNLTVSWTGPGAGSKTLRFITVNWETLDGTVYFGCSGSALGNLYLAGIGLECNLFAIGGSCSPVNVVFVANTTNCPNIAFFYGASPITFTVTM